MAGAGHRRLAAAQAAELAEVPVAELAEVPVAVVDGERLALTAVENLQRAQFTPPEEARALSRARRRGRQPEGDRRGAVGGA